MTTAELKTLFEKEYNRAEWTTALRDIFQIKDLHLTPQEVNLGENSFGATALELGSFETSEGLLVGLYEVNITPELRLDRNKVGLRNLMRKVYSNDGDAALMVFTQGHTWRFTYASELTIVNKETGKRESRQTDPKRYTYVFGKKQQCRTAIERFSGLKTTTNLFKTGVSIKEIEKAFSVDALTKDFYKELSNWYFWALQHVQFPDDAENDKEIRNSTNTIRLITRLIFVWFLKQKGLIPEILFDKEKVFKLLKNPGSSKSVYYKAILQNLFFATLNQEMGKRLFRRESQHYNITNLFRYEKFFLHPKEAIELFKNIPFLNGGLFECLDKPHSTEKTQQGHDKITRTDGFSDREDNKINVPDYLFFGGAESVDLSEEYGDIKQKNLKVRGLIEILNSYNFTVEENTPLDIQVALDPELLGQVFENLLASYNPETKTTARKQTGSFYTPREIVSYMVDESLVAYLKQKLEKQELPEDVGADVEAKLRDLVSYSGNDNQFDEAETNILVRAIDEIKVLDPACGSGAFPMGVLQQLVHLLQKLDHDNIQWKQIQMQRTIKEVESAIAGGDTESFASRLKEIAETFENNSQDYGRKLFLIENCIYGVDIQPIAVQIAKLRFFISLLCEQNIREDAENLGIRALPNLETKFVAANTLIGLDTNITFKPINVYELEKQLEVVRHRHFSARTPETKRKYRERDNQLRQQIAEELIQSGFPLLSAEKIANWNPYNQNTHAIFFDKYWMFGIENGFDVVIGNPPYGAKFTDGEKQYFKTALKHQDYQPESFLFFTEKSFDFLKINAILAFIIPNTWLTNLKLVKIRKFLTGNNLILNISHYHKSVFDAVVDTEVVIFKKGFKANHLVNVFIHSEANKVLQLQHIQNKWKEKNGDVINIFTNEKIEKLVNKLKVNSNVLSAVADLFAGVVPYEEGKGIPPQTRTMMNEKIYNSESKIDTTYREVLRGSDINKYENNWNGKRWIKYGSNLAAPRKEVIFNNPKIVIRQTGDSLIATYDDRKFISFKNTHVINQKQGTELKYILALINSSLLNFYFQYLNPETGEALAEVKKETLEKLLIKKAKDEHPFITLVDQILHAKSENPKSDTSLLERQIDEIVFKLYDLTYEEVKVIDPAFWLIEEEYNQVRIE